MTATSPPAGRRPALWRDVRALRIVAQALFLAALVAVVVVLGATLQDNLRRAGLDTGLGYLDQPAGFAIPNSDFSSGSSFLVALRYGVKNTAIVSFTGIVLATVAGVVVGVARLSSNWLVRKSAAVYVEALRNVPVLLIIFFWYFAVVLKLPAIEAAPTPFGWAVLSNRGLGVPSVTATGNVAGMTLGFAAAVVVAGAVWVWRTRQFDRTGTPHHRVAWSGLAFLAVAVGAYFALDAPFAPSLPERERLGISGGVVMNPEFAALLIALSIYTASHIAEIVRGSILAVPKGQTEAATALGLTAFQRLRFVVLPQAFRIMVPPTANQYLNLTKNSSLAVAIGYYELTKITQVTISQGGPAPQAIAVLMVFYLAFSLLISAVANVLNRRLLKDRA